MKKTLIAIIIASAFPLTGFAFFGGHGGDHHEKRLERMAEELKLTDVQKKQVGTIFKEQGEKFKVIHDETQARLAKVLTPEQLKKMEERRQERHEKWAKKHGLKPGDDKPAP
jgi:protein CpxP